MLSAIGPDIVVAVATGFWFLVFGIGKMRALPSGGRRGVAVAGWVQIVRRLRGVLEVLGALAVIAATALGLVGELSSRITLPDMSRMGLWLGLGLSVLAGWTVAEAALRPNKWVQLILALAGFALAVFYAGFR